MGIKHVFISPKTEQTDSTLVGPNEWNGNHTIDSEFGIPIIAAPATPISGLNVSGYNPAGRELMGAVGPNGFPYQYQPLVGRRRVAQWLPVPSTASITGLDVSAVTIAGTITARIPGSTNLFQSLARTGYVSAAVASSATGCVDSNSFSFWRGNAAGLGGFFCVFRFGVSDAVLNANGQMFVGLAANAIAITGAPSALTNCLGVGCDSGDTQMQLYAAGSAAQARTALGANFPVNTISTDAYELILYAPPNGTNVKYQLRRLNTGDVTSGTISNGANLPASTQFMGPNAQRNTGATATAVGIDVMGFYGECEA